MELLNKNGTRSTALDLMKLIMSLLVVGIHTEPFGFNFWLDKGFGIITRLCVPFFFVTSAYFQFIRDKSIWTYVKRIGLLYIIWSLLYLPFDIISGSFSGATVPEILEKFLWVGNDHALWYLCGSIIGALIAHYLLKLFKPRTVLIIAVAFLVVGCLKSTYAPVISKAFGCEIKDWLGSRNGLFYAFPYISMGAAVAKNKNKGKTEKSKLGYLFAGFAISFALLLAESYCAMMIFKVSATILWFSVFPLTFFAFMLGNNLYLNISKEKSVFMRKLSTLIYVSHCMFKILFSGLKYIPYFAAVALSAIGFSLLILYLCRFEKLKFLKYLY